MTERVCLPGDDGTVRRKVVSEVQKTLHGVGVKVHG